MSSEKSWASPFAPSDSSAWPNHPCKTYWIGPFDLDRNFSAKIASQNMSPEAPELQRLRRLADIQHTEGDHIGARSSLAHIVEQYISDYERTSPWIGDYQDTEKKRHVLIHRIKTTVGGIINSYFTQYPELSDILQDQKHEREDCEQLFSDAVEKERDFEDPRVLYTIRVILYYAATELFQSDPESIWKKYKQILSCTEGIFGSQHPDIICLLQGLAQAIMKTYRKQSQRAAEEQKLQWKAEVKALLSRALSGLQKLYGYTASPTLDCAYEMATFHRTCGEGDMAASTVREMCEITTQELGEEHDETLRFKAELSSLLIEQNRLEEAGLNVHKYISEHWEEIRNASTSSGELTLRGKHIEKRGWRAMILLNDELSRYQAPFGSKWADHNLYTLPVRNVTLVPVFPSEKQKNRAWSFDRVPDAETQALLFQSSVNSNLSVDLQVPYIPYAHFMSTTSPMKPIFDDPYLQYVKAREDLSRIFYQKDEVNPLIKENERFTNAEKCLNVKLGSYGHLSEVQGFFNYIPTDSSLLVGETFGPQPDLVSSKWEDWKQFTLHAPPNNTPLLRLPDGTELRCHGYISGTWTDIDLKSQRKIFKLFVVDAVFSGPRIPDDITYLFALSADTLKSPRYHELSGIDKRMFCGTLNPSLFTRFNDGMGHLVYPVKKMKDFQVNNPSEDADHWKEMNRREQWDRDFELRKPASQEDRDELKRAFSIEEQARSA